MLDPKNLLDQLLGSRVPGTGETVRQKADQAAGLARQNPIATGALLTVLLGTKAGRRLGGTALKAGGLAAIAGLAYHAWRAQQDGGVAPGTGADAQIPPPPAGSDFDIEAAPQGADSFAMALIRAMIAAARADGHVDEAERERIASRIRLAGLDADAASFLMQEVERPVDIDALVAAARSEAQRVELYTAARLAIEPHTRMERGFLDLLAGRLALSDTLIDHVEATVSAAQEPA